MSEPEQPLTREDVHPRPEEGRTFDVDPDAPLESQGDPVIDSTPLCDVHGVALEREPGGTDKATAHGRTFCPRCHEQFVRTITVDSGSLNVNAT